MESLLDSCTNMYEVEKIINCKSYRNKKYYLIKWLCYPINQSTWEPKSNLKNLNYMIEEFEREYPYSIDQNMYNIFCEELKKKKSFKNISKSLKDIPKDIKFIAKKRKIECFSDFELNNDYLDKLKTHLHININKKQSKGDKHPNEDLIIDLSSSATQSEENISNNSCQVVNLKATEEKSIVPKLIMPKLI